MLSEVSNANAVERISDSFALAGKAQRASKASRYRFFID